MFSGGDYDEVARWLRNFVSSHAKRENPRVEAVVEAGRGREGESYGVRLRLGEALHPPSGATPIVLTYDEVARDRGDLAWCASLAGRVRALAPELSRAGVGSQRSA